MAVKSSKKSRKTTSSQKEETQPTSTVTPINRGVNGSESQSRGPQAIELEIEEQIRVRAYELFEQRGRQEGFHHEDWERAKTEVLAKYHREKSA
ncbi:MAG TPA: DUF2934 domain-containing protein [Candidatus Angelobacter sp.]|jgi:hypothetical protein